MAAAASIAPEIVARQLMSVDALRLPGLVGAGGFAAEQVHAMRDRFEVTRIAARAIAAQVVDLSAIRQWADKQLVGAAVRLDATARQIGIAVASSPVAVAWIGPAVVRAIGARREMALEHGWSAHAAIYCRWAPDSTRA
jgi:hypothetical protein